MSVLICTWGYIIEQTDHKIPLVKEQINFLICFLYFDISVQIFISYSNLFLASIVCKLKCCFYFEYL